MNAALHPVASEEIMALFDGELSAAQAQSVSAHLDSCIACRTQAEELRSTMQKLSSWQVGTAPAIVTDRVQAAAASGPAPKGSLGSSIFPRPSFWTWKQWLGGLAVAVAVLVFFLLSGAPRFLRSRSTAYETAEYDRGRGSVDNATVNSFEKSKPQTKATKPIRSLREPAIVTDSNGNFRSRGEHAQDSFSIDGQLTPDRAQSTGGYKTWLSEEGKNSLSLPGAPPSGPMIARIVSLAIVAKDFDASRKSLDAILVRHNGYSANLNVSTPQDAARALQGSLRIPAPQLVAALTELKTLGRVENESQNGEEVTQQHADLVARLKNSRETEQRLQAILTQRTGKISDVLQVEQSIARVRGEIEQMEAEQKNLEHRVDFATIDLNLTEEYQAQLNSPAPSVSVLLHNALVNGFRNAFESLLILLLFLTESAPTLLLWLAILFLPARFLWRRYHRAHALAA